MHTMPADTRTARIADLAPDGTVILHGEDGAMPALVLSTVPLAHLRRALADGLPVLIAGDAHRPVVLGVVLDRAEEAPSLTDADGRTVLAAERQLVLRCGGGQIAITADGRVAIRGDEVRSQARRLQRITGAQVKIN